jgi:tetratricopeptide (TPR) repeat protein
MSNLADGSIAKSPDLHEPIRALLRAGKNDEAIVQLCAIGITSPDDFIARELLLDAFYQKRAWAPALVLAEQLSRERPGVPRLRKSVIATLSNMKRYDETIVEALRYIERHGEDLTILDALKVAHFYTGKIDEAVSYGQRALELRDAEACRLPPAFAITVPAGAPSGDSVISFSLWGTQAFYCYGAMINLVLSREIYPGWTCRFYVDATVPPACVAFLRDNGADLRRIEDEYPAVGLFQRFLVMNDSTVGRFLVRDCDARLSVAEADLVQLFYVRPDRQVWPRPAHARPDAVALDPQALPGPRQILPAQGHRHIAADRSQEPLRRRPPEYRGGAGGSGAAGHSEAAVGDGL